MCSVGLERLAYLLVAYSLGASAASVLGLLWLWLPRPVPLVAGAGVHLLLTLSLFFWAPAPRVLQHIWILYIAAILWGVGSALNKTGLSSEYSHGRWDGWAGDPVTTSGWWRKNTDIPGTDMGSRGCTEDPLWRRRVRIPVDPPRSGSFMGCRDRGGGLWTHQGQVWELHAMDILSTPQGGLGALWTRWAEGGYVRSCGYVE